MTGDLSLLGLAPFLQAAAQQASKGYLVVRHEGRSRSIYFDGRSVHLVAGAPTDESTEALYDLFTWEEAEFEFREAATPVEPLPSPVPITALVLEAARRKDELREIRRIIRSHDMVPSLSGRALPQDDPGFDPAIVAELGARIDGVASVSDLLELSVHPQFEVERTLARLVTQGFAVCGDATAPLKRGDTTIIHAPRPEATVLVISSLPHYGQALAEALSAQGYGAALRSPFQDLAGAIGVMDPVAIVLDLVDSAIDLAHCARLSKMTRAPIVLLVSNPSPEGVLRAAKQGAREVLIKPVTMELLKARLERVVGEGCKTPVGAAQ